MTRPVYRDTDSTTKATMIAVAMVNAVHPDDRVCSTYEDAANDASLWLDSQGVGNPDVGDITQNLAKCFGVDYWDF